MRKFSGMLDVAVSALMHPWGVGGGLVGRRPTALFISPAPTMALTAMMHHKSQFVWCVRGGGRPGGACPVGCTVRGNQEVGGWWRFHISRYKVLHNLALRVTQHPVIPAAPNYGNASLPGLAHSPSLYTDLICYYITKQVVA